MSWRRTGDLVAVVSVHCWSMFVDLYRFLHLPLGFVLFAQHLDKVEGNWVTCQINVFLDCIDGVVAISMLLEPLGWGFVSLSNVLFMTHPTLHIVD